MFWKYSGDVIVQNGATSIVGQCIIQLARARGVYSINIIRDRCTILCIFVLLLTFHNFFKSTGRFSYLDPERISSCFWVWSWERLGCSYRWFFCQLLLLHFGFYYLQIFIFHHIAKWLQFPLWYKILLPVCVLLHNLYAAYISWCESSLICRILTLFCLVTQASWHNWSDKETQRARRNWGLHWRRIEREEQGLLGRTAYSFCFRPGIIKVPFITEFFGALRVWFVLLISPNAFRRLCCSFFFLFFLRLSDTIFVAY